jgi:cation transport ATPase
MNTKSIVALLVLIIFTVGTIGIAFAAEKGAVELKGTITKIEGNKITVKDAAGKETTVEVKSTANIKVGDRVTVKDGEVTRERPRRVIEGC